MPMCCHLHISSSIRGSPQFSLSVASYKLGNLIWQGHNQIVIVLNIERGPKTLFIHTLVGTFTVSDLTTRSERYLFSVTKYPVGFINDQISSAEFFFSGNVEF